MDGEAGSSTLQSGPLLRPTVPRPYAVLSLIRDSCEPIHSQGGVTIGPEQSDGKKGLSLFLVAFSRLRRRPSELPSQDSEATELSQLMAYFDYQDVWYELFQAGAEDLGLWWADVVKNKMRFNRAMSELYDYSLVETVRETTAYTRACTTGRWNA